MFARLIQTPLVIRDLDNRGFVLGSIGSPVEVHHAIGEYRSLEDGDRSPGGFSQCVHGRGGSESMQD
jgi:hypothetical protein